MDHSRRLILAAAVFAAACGAKTAPQPAMIVEHSLATLSGQHVVMLPVYSVRVVPPLLWNSAVGRPADLKKMLDADIASAFDDRGLKKLWVFPDDLAQSYRNNSTYAADPYSLAEEMLRSPALTREARLTEPLASQLRTLIALYQDTRFVLAPVELRFEQAGTNGEGRGVLRLVLIDPRLSQVLWIGEVVSDPVSSYGPVISASIGARLAAAVSAQ